MTQIKHWRCQPTSKGVPLPAGCAAPTEGAISQGAPIPFRVAALSPQPPNPRPCTLSVPSSGGSSELTRGLTPQPVLGKCVVLLERGGGNSSSSELNQETGIFLKNENVQKGGLGSVIEFTFSHFQAPQTCVDSPGKPTSPRH